MERFDLATLRPQGLNPFTLARQCCEAGGQALITHPHNRKSGPTCFHDQPLVGQLFDGQRARLWNTAMRLGVKRVVIKEWRAGLFVTSLCRTPLEKALSEAQDHKPQPAEV